MKCPICDRSIEPEDKKYLYGNDRPYFNVYIHHSCFDENRSNMIEYFPKMLEMYRIVSKKR